MSSRSGSSEFESDLTMATRPAAWRWELPRTEKDILAEVRALAVEYYQLTGKPLGVTGEIGEVEAAEIMNLELGTARTDGYDAIRRDGPYKLVQIKSR